MSKKGRDAYIELLKSFRIYFKAQARILYKEVKTIKYATNYYRKYEEYYNIDSIDNLSQEALELESIFDGIRALEKKSYALVDIFRSKKINSEDGKKERGDFSKIIDNINNIFDNSHINILPIIDSIINHFSELYDELNFYKQTYFNLVDSKEFSYIPSPKFNKRFRNANLGLYINKQLNDKTKNSYRTLVSDFYKKNNFSSDEQIKKFEKINFMSTWSYTNDHLIKKFTSDRNVHKKNNNDYVDYKNRYISMSYTYLDKSIFQPITLHEISHSMENKELTDEQKNMLNDSLYIFKNKNLFRKDNPLCDLYKEILCDLSAFYAIGHSYIISLVHVGFFELETLFFDKDNKICYGTNNSYKIPNSNELAPKNFDFNVNNIYLSVRLMILIDVCKKLKIDNSYINGIEYMLSIIFPKDKYYELSEFENHIEKDQPNFLKIYEFLSENSFYYKQSRNLVYSLYEKFKSILFNKEFFENFKTKDEDKGLDFFIKHTKKYNKDIKENFNHNYSSIYDLLWLIREKKPKYNNSNLQITERDVNRLFNIYNIFLVKKGDISYKNKRKWIRFNTTSMISFFNIKKERFYNLELIKYRATQGFHPYVEFMNLKRNNFCCGYVFAPYDIVTLKPVEYTSNLSSIFSCYPFRGNISKEEKNKYFIDRHSLYLLKEIKGKYEGVDEIEKINRDFDLILEIKLDNIFSTDDNIMLFVFLENYFDLEKKKFDNCKIFKSLGGEDYIVYIKGLQFQYTVNYGKKMISEIYKEYERAFVDIEDLVILNNPQINYTKKDNNIKASFSSFAKINKKHKEANNYFAKIQTDNLKYILPEEKYISRHYSPTNRFDCIISWEEQEDENIFTVFKNYLEKIYYKDKDEEPFFADFNIEIFYKQYYDEWKKEENKE